MVLLIITLQTELSDISDIKERMTNPIKDLQKSVDSTFIKLDIKSDYGLEVKE